MTRKDYELIASAVKELTADYYAKDKQNTAELFARVFANTNPLFNAEKFIKACGVNN
jgi:hypothetical protein